MIFLSGDWIKSTCRSFFQPIMGKNTKVNFLTIQSDQKVPLSCETRTDVLWKAQQSKMKNIMLKIL